VDPEEQAAADAAAAAAAAADKKDEKPDANVAELERLRAELASRDASLAQFEGLDPAAAKAAIAARDASEAAKRDAEKAKAEAEGNWERVRELMVAERDAKEAALQAQIEELKTGKSAADARLDNMAIDRAFNESKFLREKVALPVGKVRTLFHEHAEVVDGETVVYDKPKGAAKRTMLVDGSGKPLGFEAAIEKVIMADPDKDDLLKSNAKPGAGSRTDGGKTDPDTGKSRHQLFAEGFANLRASNRR